MMGISPDSTNEDGLTALHQVKHIDIEVEIGQFLLLLTVLHRQLRRDDAVAH